MSNCSSVVNVNALSSSDQSWSTARNVGAWLRRPIRTWVNTSNLPTRLNCWNIIAQRARRPAARQAGDIDSAEADAPRGRHLEPVDRSITPMKPPAPISGDTSSTAGFGAVTPRSMTSIARQRQGASRLRVRLRYGELSLREDVSRPRALASPARRLYSSAALLRRQVRQRPSSSGPGRRPFTAKTGVRFPLGAPEKTKMRTRRDGRSACYAAVFQ